MQQTSLESGISEILIQRLHVPLIAHHVNVTVVQLFIVFKVSFNKNLKTKRSDNKLTTERRKCVENITEEGRRKKYDV